MGSAKAETERRARTGAAAIRKVRFAAPNDLVGTEEIIINNFVSALASGDAKTAAQLLDPLPYGGGDTEAMRLVAANRLLADQDWKRFASTQAEKVGDTSWRISSNGLAANLNLRRTTEFAFIQSISVGE